MPALTKDEEAQLSTTQLQEHQWKMAESRERVKRQTDDLKAIYFQKLHPPYMNAKNGLLNAITLVNTAFPATRSEPATVIDNYKVAPSKEKEVDPMPTTDVKATKKSDKEKASGKDELSSAMRTRHINIRYFLLKIGLQKERLKFNIVQLS